MHSKRCLVKIMDCFLEKAKISSIKHIECPSWVIQMTTACATCTTVHWRINITWSGCDIPLDT